MNFPTQVTPEELAAILRDAAGRVENGDSFSGFIEYDCMDARLDDNNYGVRAIYRTGNREGQGGYRTIGQSEKPDWMDEEHQSYEDVGGETAPSGDLGIQVIRGGGDAAT